MKPKTDRTYLIEGSFNTTELIFSVLLPQQTVTSKYSFSSKAYNITKRINGNVLNAICFFMKKNGSTSVLNSGDTYYQRMYKLNALVDHNDADVLPFDSNLDDCVVVVIHNDYDATLVEDAFSNLESDYANAQLEEPYVRLNKKKDTLIQPRVLGVSIIKR